MGVGPAGGVLHALLRGERLPEGSGGRNVRGHLQGAPGGGRVPLRLPARAHGSAGAPERRRGRHGPAPAARRPVLGRPRRQAVHHGEDAVRERGPQRALCPVGPAAHPLAPRQARRDAEEQGPRHSASRRSGAGLRGFARSSGGWRSRDRARGAGRRRPRRRGRAAGCFREARRRRPDPDLGALARGAGARSSRRSGRCPRPIGSRPRSIARATTSSP